MKFFRGGRGDGAGHSLPTDIVSMMERFARIELGIDSPANSMEVWDTLQQPLAGFAKDEPTRFMDELRDAVRDASGLAKYGAAHTVNNLVPPDAVGGDAYTDLLDGDLQYLRDSGLPPNRTTGFEWQRWIASGGTAETWIPMRPAPTPDTVSVTPLAANERRKVAEVAAGDEINLIVIEHGEGDRLLAHIATKRGPDSELPPSSGPPWKHSESLFELYRNVALALQIPPLWCDAELAPFFPLAPPSI
jgi:hypothetical protein